MVASAGDDDYGRLSVSLAARARTAALFTVGRGAFRPPPKVESAVVRVVPCPPDFVIEDQASFDALVTRAFSQRRKTLANSLRSLLSRAEIADLGLDPMLRPEQLTPAQFALLANHVCRRDGAMERTAR
jgi:16S rRNA (adenine1518-N6/adenine1519-N6)-dimethyltransferase